MGLFDNTTKTHVVHATYRFLQFVLAITVCGLYGVDLAKAHKEGKYSDSKWVFAEVTASLSAVTAVLYIIPFLARIPFIWIWDVVLSILWITVFGLFGKLYIHAHAEGDAGIQRMKNAVWVDLTNLFLWVISAIVLGVFGGRLREKTRFTGRAVV